ncbi:MAG: class I SAM-dependent methyltransferase [Candidatus Sulfotelmatobacter sp.]|jgi:2-polyprenyl-3-methyl-5-hydroxy-6-metoxy-1,4-benzoquinol methylase
MSSDAIQIAKDEGIVEIKPRQGAEGFEITLTPHRSDLYVPRRSCQTRFPLELIRYWLDRVSFASFCEVIGRHEETIPRALKQHLFAYFAPEDFVGKRLLDFGCGSGASTFALARMLPETEVMGVELAADRIEIANHVRSYLGLQNMEFRVSPSGDKLPPGIGEFDFVMLSAVYEHLLPVERKTVMPLLWSAMKTGGVIFVNQTPYRYSPYEAHSTGLWLVNYMPDGMAHWTVRHFAKRNLQINRSADWNVHLRGGLRGGTEKEIVQNLASGEVSKAEVLQPRQNGLRDRADFWLSCTNPQRLYLLKKFIAAFFRLADGVLGTMPALNLEVVVRKLRP